MKIAWFTDIHLDCVDNLQDTITRLKIEANSSEAVIITGDISVGTSIVQHLKQLESSLNKPIYFVMGNHDYYFSNILETRRKVTEACRYLSFSKYLGAMPYVKLNNSTVLIGSDGWYDGINGNVADSEIIMNDWLKINDFAPAIRPTVMGRSLDKGIILQIARSICKASVAHVFKGIKATADDFDHLIIATHFPPFVESYTKAKFDGIDADLVIPWYTSRMMGEMLLSAAKTYPNTQFTVLSGHTHGRFTGDILPNLHAKVGKSQYGAPQIAGNVDI
jgi:predicted MPP superfamily phosphohydrolase